MKHYCIILIPDRNATKKIEKLRMRLIGAKLVDGAVPHLSFKRRFVLKKGTSQKSLLRQLSAFKLGAVSLRVNKIARTKNTISILLHKKKSLLKKHKELLSTLEETTATFHPEYEGRHFLPHVTIVRDTEKKMRIKTNDAPARNITFDTLQLIELDPAPARKWNRLIASKKLMSTK